MKVGATDPRAIDVYGKGDIKGGYVAIGKGAGSIACGVAGGVVATLLGKVVAGVAVAAGGYGAGKRGEWVGETIAQGINKVAF